MANQGTQVGLALVTVWILAAACGGKQENSTGQNSAGKGQAGGGVSSAQAGTAQAPFAGASSGGVTMATGGAHAGSSSDELGGSDDPGGSGGAGGAEGEETPVDPYAPRTGSFKLLAYGRTAGFRHDGSIETAVMMLKQIGSEQGFDVVTTESNELITAEGLAQFEIVFFNNTSGDIFTEKEQQIYETWMITRQGAFAGVHAATDTESGWAFYSEVTGQFYDGHGAANAPDKITFEPDAVDHPAVKGLPNPWERAEEWKKFNSYQVWQNKPGFQILGRKAADGQPAAWVRQWSNFRSFYT